jgi:hypothetical protein
MIPKQRLPFAQWAEINRTDRFISIEALSGYSLLQRDDNSFIAYLDPDVTDDTLGFALLEIFRQSRYIWPDDEPDFLDADRYLRCYRRWQRDFMLRYGYESLHEAYANMDWCRARKAEGTISIQPHKRDEPEYFMDLPPERTVMIAETTDVFAVGAAVRLALERCE